MSIDQSLDLVNSVNNEHVHKIFTRSIQPVIEWLQQIPDI